jgi:hypothetical protein
VIDRTTFLARIEEYRGAGWRLAFINATTNMSAGGEAERSFEVVWGFSRDGREGGGALDTIREIVLADEEVPSVSESFGAAFLYENELRELFGINVTGLGLDLHGQLYKTATTVPFSHRAVRARIEATAAKAAAEATAKAAEATAKAAEATAKAADAAKADA